MVSWSFTQWHDISIMGKSKPANQMQSGALKCAPEYFFAGQKCQPLECWRTVFGLEITLRWIILKLCEASWRLHKKVLRTGLRLCTVCKFENFSSPIQYGQSFKHSQYIHLDKNNNNKTHTHTKVQVSTICTSAGQTPVWVIQPLTYHKAGNNCPLQRKGRVMTCL